jgi:hypothetical protein
MALAPHFDLPFTFGAVCEQGSQRDLANCVFAVVVCPKGFRHEVPNFGILSPAFDSVPVMNEDLKGDIAEQEPRAELIFDEREGMSQFERLVKVYVRGGN